MIDVPAQAERRENRRDPIRRNRFPRPDPHFRGQGSITGRDPPSGDLKVKAGVGGPSGVLPGRLPDTPERRIGESQMDPRRADLFQSCDIFRPAILEVLLPRRPLRGSRNSLRALGAHFAGGRAAENTVSTVTLLVRASCVSRAPQESTASSRCGDTNITAEPGILDFADQLGQLIDSP